MKDWKGIVLVVGAVFVSIFFYFLIHIGYGAGFFRGLIYGRL